MRERMEDLVLRAQAEIVRSLEKVNTLNIYLLALSRVFVFVFAVLFWFVPILCRRFNSPD